MLNPEKYLDEVEFAETFEPRCACMLLLDTSGSMQGEPIQCLNEGYKAFLDTIKQDDLALLRVELCVVTFGGTVQVVQEFTTIDRISPKPFLSDGGTPMGEAITTAVAKVRERKNVYRSNGIRYYRPWVFMITDGEPTDAWESAAALVQEQERAKHLSFFAVGVEGANMTILREISVRPPVRLKGLSFAQMFEWLSGSLSSVSESGPGDRVELAPVDGWGDVAL